MEVDVELLLCVQMLKVFSGTICGEGVGVGAGYCSLAFSICEMSWISPSQAGTSWILSAGTTAKSSVLFSQVAPVWVLIALRAPKAISSLG